MKDKLKSSIIKTLCYSQIFSYPLTVSELWKYLITGKKIDKEEFIDELNKPDEDFERVGQYVVFPGDRKLILERTIRAQESKRKLAKALWVSQLLSFIPWIKLIAISGSLSMYNAKPQDDIDLFFITGKNRLWTTRFLVNVFLLFLGEKRNKKEKYAMDKICPNMFISEDTLKIKTHDLYIAHEIAQIKVLVSKDNMYQKFLKSNEWVLRFLPNAFLVNKVSQGHSRKQISHLPLLVCELILFKIQYLYMKKRITNEKVDKNMASFHPLKQGEIILELYKLRISSYKGFVKTSKSVKNLLPFHVVN